jgi:putative integral membrane protein (TIGR02587 family)
MSEGWLARWAPRTARVGLARAFGGAVIFGLPMLMTMEMWHLGANMERSRLAIMVLLNLPLLVALSHHIGFEATSRFRDDVVDALVAYAVAFVASGLVLALFAELDLSMSIDEINGKILLQAVPGSIGATLASKELGGGEDNDDLREPGEDPTYVADLFYMIVGAVFLAFNMAPTEEMILIAFQMTPWHALALVAASLGLMHAFVYAVEFRGQHAAPPDSSLWVAFVRYTVVGYALALLICLYVLWTFGRLDDLSTHRVLTSVVVLSFPASIGAAAARLIL